MSLYLAKATDSALKVGATWQMGTTSLDVHVLLGICGWSCLRGIPWGCLLIFVQEASLLDKRRAWQVLIKLGLKLTSGFNPRCQEGCDSSNGDRENESDAYETSAPPREEHCPVWLLGTRELRFKPCCRVFRELLLIVTSLSSQR